MSQAKVDRYKEQKKNRQQIMKKEKREWIATKVGLSAVGIVMVAWIGFSVYTGMQPKTDENASLPNYTVNTSALDDYTAALSAEE